MFLGLVGTACAALAAPLPTGPEKAPVPSPHFPSRLHAYVWRNWQVVPVERLAEVVGATPKQIRRIGHAMGLSGPPQITPEQQARLSTTIIRRNWHLLPYDQLLDLLGWTEDELNYTLREDDFLFVKLGNLKPICEPLRYEEPTDDILAREREIAAIAAEAFPEGVGDPETPPLAFVDDLARMPEHAEPIESRFNPRYCFSYFGLTGDPLMEGGDCGYPDGLLARLAASGVNGVWLQAVLYKLAPFPWDESLSEGSETRLANLRALCERAAKYGVRVYMYLNEPRAMPVEFFDDHPDLRGVTEGTHATLCTSLPEVRDYLRDGLAHVCRNVPELGGFFSISASENLTSCWSHHRGDGCPRCSERPPAEVIAEVNRTFKEGLDAAGTGAELIVWDWGWQDGWAEAAIAGLPDGVSLQSVSEWSIPIERGGVQSVVGEYSISEVGPGPRATRHWGFAKARGLRIIAKIQAGTTWEMSAVPDIPAVANVAQHVGNLRDAGVDGLMAGWTLGGYPSPNLEVVAEMGRGEPTVGEALAAVAQRRVGPEIAPHVVRAWKGFSEAFGEFPFHIGLCYTGPQQMGPANPLWGAPTGYAATMVGFPYDNLDSWRAVFPPEVFISQFDKVARGFESTLHELRHGVRNLEGDRRQLRALADEIRLAEVCALHFHSCADQARFILARDAGNLDAAEAALRQELSAAVRLQHLQAEDSRIGFEASNQYYYLSVDLAEKVINCRDLLDRWLPEQRAQLGAD